MYEARDCGSSIGCATTVPDVRIVNRYVRDVPSVFVVASLAALAGWLRVLLGGGRANRHRRPRLGVGAGGNHRTRYGLAQPHRVGVSGDARVGRIGDARSGCAPHRRAANARRRHDAVVAAVVLLARSDELFSRPDGAYDRDASAVPRRAHRLFVYQYRALGHRFSPGVADTCCYGSGNLVGVVA